MKVQRSLGGGRVSIPRVFSSSGKSECLLSAEVIKVGGGGVADSASL